MKIKNSWTSLSEVAIAGPAVALLFGSKPPKSGIATSIQSANAVTADLAKINGHC